MSFVPYLNFNGNCREVMTIYADIFGATDLSVMTFGDGPPEFASPETKDLVMHSAFSSGPGAWLYASDVPPGMEWSGVNGSISYDAPSAERAQSVFAALAEGGTIWMPLGPTFWSPLFGGVTDRFGTSWMISFGPPAT